MSAAIRLSRAAGGFSILSLRQAPNQVAGIQTSRLTVAGAEVGAGPHWLRIVRTAEQGSAIHITLLVPTTRAMPWASNRAARPRVTQSHSSLSALWSGILSWGLTCGMVLSIRA